MIRTSRATRYTQLKKAECNRELLKNNEAGTNQYVTINEFGEKVFADSGVSTHKHGGNT